MVSPYQAPGQEQNRDRARDILDAARQFRQFEQWSYGDSINAARELKLPWLEIGQQLGVSDKTAREIHKKYLRGDYPAPTAQDESEYEDLYRELPNNGDGPERDGGDDA